MRMDARRGQASDFGAKGDGTSDDSEAIRHALSCLPDGGGEIHFPRGTYVVSQHGSNPWCVNLSGNNVMLRGSGRGATVLKRKTGNGSRPGQGLCGCGSRSM